MTSDASLSSRLLHRRHGIFQIRGLPTLEPLRSVQHTAPPAGKQMSVPLSNQAYYYLNIQFRDIFAQLTLGLHCYASVSLAAIGSSAQEMFRGEVL